MFVFQGITGMALRVSLVTPTEQSAAARSRQTVSHARNLNNLLTRSQIFAHAWMVFTGMETPERLVTQTARLVARQTYASPV